ncbi:hypothetical protein VHEMI10012 [[Torrubiella] hemipterigena]|uniref:Peptidase S53 activation domain-containing protein n=1 Tax=[Torrubiella] hemipterigena TaxID=1531966 RepID=A0A0A1TBM9_9HYPO|nr:hypothetical protein VHEMI10012 [[Torrubiella] hemipterigena]
MKIAAIFLSAFVTAALGVPMGTSVVHEKRSQLPSHLSKRSAESDVVVPVRIALKQRNLDKGMDLIMDVSDPESKNSGKHYTQEQIVELFKPSEDYVNTVRDWLVKAGIPADQITLPNSQSCLGFHTTVRQLSKMLNTEYNFYVDSETDNEHFGTEQYALPATIADHADFITPGASAMRVRGKRSSPRRKMPLRAPPTNCASLYKDLKQVVYVMS